MTDPKDNKAATNTVSKSLKYSVITCVVNFDPNKYSPKVIFVNGVAAVQLKGNLYTKRSI